MTREQFIAHVEDTRKAFRRFLTGLCCGDTMQADDIAQEAYIKAWLSCDGLNSSDRFKAWLYRIGINTFLGDRRRQRPISDYSATSDMAATETADEAFRYQPLYQALDMLSERERSSLLLYYLEGYQVKEIAEIVGVTADAVRQHLSRGRVHLRKILQL